MLVQRSSSIVSNASSHASSSSAAPKHTYHGHRRNSFTTNDVEELTELRARQRMHNGAYERTALGTSVYAIVLLKIFSPAFARSASARSSRCRLKQRHRSYLTLSVAHCASISQSA